MIYFGLNCALASIGAFLPTIIATLGFSAYFSYSHHKFYAEHLLFSSGVAGMCGHAFFLASSGVPRRLRVGAYDWVSSSREDEYDLRGGTSKNRKNHHDTPTDKQRSWIECADRRAR